MKTHYLNNTPVVRTNLHTFELTSCYFPHDAIIGELVSFLSKFCECAIHEPSGVDAIEIFAYGANHLLKRGCYINLHEMSCNAPENIAVVLTVPAPDAVGNCISVVIMGDQYTPHGAYIWLHPGDKFADAVMTRVKHTPNAQFSEFTRLCELISGRMFSILPRGSGAEHDIVTMARIKYNIHITLT